MESIFMIFINFISTIYDILNFYIFFKLQKLQMNLNLDIHNLSGSSSTILIQCFQIFDSLVSLQQQNQINEVGVVALDCLLIQIIKIYWYVSQTIQTAVINAQISSIVQYCVQAQSCDQNQLEIKGLLTMTKFHNNTIVGVYAAGATTKLIIYLLKTSLIHEKLLSRFVVGLILLSTNEIFISYNYSHRYYVKFIN
ncbi:hypothetical protein pb186bvf_000261 [Paramecium bursaria]